MEHHYFEDKINITEPVKAKTKNYPKLKYTAKK